MTGMNIGKQFFLTLSLGIVFGSGFTITILWLNTITPYYTSHIHHFNLLSNNVKQHHRLNKIEAWISIQNGHENSLLDSTQSNKTFPGSVKPNESISQNSRLENIHQSNSSEAEKLFKKVRVLCWILTGPENHLTRAIHVRNTWGQRCNKLLFMSSKADKKLGSIALPNIKEGKKYLWGKTKQAFRYIYEHHFEDADWFMKADDDTYVIVENLRFLLKDYNSSQPISFGRKFKTIGMIGGAGYVLSKEALRRFVQIAIPNKKNCSAGHSGDEDFQLCRCLSNVDVKMGDSSESYGHHRFFQMPIQHAIEICLKKPSKCCSNKAISFHHILPDQMYVMDYLIYHLSPYGIRDSNEMLIRQVNNSNIYFH